MKTLSKDGFKLPFIGKDKFSELMRMGVGYDRKNRIFFLRSKANTEIIKKILGDILKEDVEFETPALSKFQTCYLCKTQITCKKCEYYENCPTREQPFGETGLYCMCPACENKKESYLLYIQKEQQ